jgi:hypothetical protein
MPIQNFKLKLEFLLSIQKRQLRHKFALLDGPEFVMVSIGLAVDSMVEGLHHFVIDKGVVSPHCYSPPCVHSHQLLLIDLIFSLESFDRIFILIFKFLTSAIKTLLFSMISPHDRVYLAPLSTSSLGEPKPGLVCEGLNDALT